MTPPDKTPEQVSEPRGQIRPNGIERKMKNEVGDWVAARFEGGDRPGKVVAATRDSVTVRFRFASGESDLIFDEPLPRIRWRGDRGRRRWTYV